MKPAAPQPTHRRGSFAEHHLDTKPYRTDEASDDNCNHSLERIALRLLDTLAPASQVLKIGAQFDSVDQLERPVGAVLDGLRGLAPAAIQDGVRSRNPRRRRRLGIAHDADKNIERGPGMAAR